MILLDEIRYVKVKNLRYTNWSHMASDTSLDELHEIAYKIGMKREWFQNGKFKHYDVTPVKRKLALKNGAVEVTSRELVRRMVNE